MGLSMLALARKANNLTQAQLAAKVGCDRSHLAQIEVGRAPLTLDFARRVSPFVDTDPTELVVGQLATAQTAAARKAALTAARALADVLEDPSATASAKSQAKAILETNLEILEDLAAADQVDGSDEAATKSRRSDDGDDVVPIQRDAFGRVVTELDVTRDALGRARKSRADDDRHRRDALGRRR